MSSLDMFENHLSIEELQMEMDTNLTMLKQTSILDDEFDDLHGTLGGSLFDPTGNRLSPLEMSDILLSPTVTPRTKPIDEEKQFLDGQFFEKEIMVKKEKEETFYITKMDFLLPNIKYETPSGNLIEKKGANSFFINEKKIHFPSPLDNSAELLNLNPGSQQDLLTEDKVLPNISERKSVAHNIRLMAASRLLSEAQEDETGEWLFTPNFQTNFSVAGSKAEKMVSDVYVNGESSEDEFFQTSPVLQESDVKYANDEKAKKQQVNELINPPQPVTITKSRPKNNVMDSLRRSEPSLKPKDSYKPQFFNPTNEIKCKEPSDKKKQQWEKKSSTNTSTVSIATTTKKSTLKDTIPTNATMFPPLSSQNSPPRGSILSLASSMMVNDVRKSVERVPIKVSTRVKTPTVVEPKLKKKPNTTGNSKRLTTSRPNSPLTTVESFLESKQDLDQYDIAETCSEISVTDSENFDNDFVFLHGGDGSNTKNWKLMQWRRENSRERTHSSSVPKNSHESKSDVGFISVVFDSQTCPDYKPSYEAIVIARDIVLDAIETAANKAIEQRTIEQYSIAFFNKVDVTRNADDIIASSLNNSNRLVLNVNISLYLDQMLTELDWIEEDVPCFVEFYKIFDNDPTRLPSSFKIVAFYHTVVNLGGESNLLEKGDLSKSFYYNIDVVQNNKIIPFERGAKYEWRLRENLYLPVPFADRKQKSVSSRNSPSLQSTFCSLFRVKDLKGPENEKFISPYHIEDTPKAAKTDENIFAVNLNASQSNSPQRSKHTHTKNVNDTLQTDDIQLSPIFMPSSPLPKTDKNLAQQSVPTKETKCCIVM